MNSTAEQAAPLRGRPMGLPALALPAIAGSRLAGCAVVPFTVAPNEFEQGVGSRVAVADAILRRRELEAGFIIVGIGREPRLEAARVHSRERMATSSAARARAISGFSAIVPQEGHREAPFASSVSPPATQRSSERPGHFHIVRRHLLDLAEDARSRARRRRRPAPARPSRSAARSRPSELAPSGSIFSWLKQLIKSLLSWPSVR